MELDLQETLLADLLNEIVTRWSPRPAKWKYDSLQDRPEPRKSLVRCPKTEECDQPVDRQRREVHAKWQD